jgi:DHA1 family L-arabinose/isopropyl-beta-D-thiogalactopyranoside export protein-like MFS transporter
MFASLLMSWKPWLPVVCLTISAFIFNTTEFAPISLLTDIAADFHISEAHAGFMMTAYAWIVATMSLPLMLLTKDMERRKLLLLLFSFFIVSHILSVLAWNFWILMLSRIGIAFSHAIFWSITASLTYRLAPHGKKTKALGILATGTSLAIVLGLPLGRLIGQSLGWRTTFACIALVAFVILFFLLKLLPQLPSVNAGSLKSLPLLIKRPSLMGVYVLTALAITAHFTAYSYIEPFVQQIALLSGDFATITLFIFGIAGMLGSTIFAHFKHTYPFTIVVSSLTALIVSLIFMLPLAPYQIPLSILCLFWGIAICLISLILQVTVLELTPDATDVAMSLYSGIYNIGIGGGAFVGSLVISHSSMKHVGIVGALFGSVALVLAIWIWRKYLLKKA